MLVFLPSLLEQIILEVNAWLTERTSVESAFIIFGVGPTEQVGFEACEPITKFQPTTSVAWNHSPIGLQR